MRDKFVSLYITCKITFAAYKNLQNFISFSSAKFWKQNYKFHEILWRNLKDITAADKI